MSRRKILVVCSAVLLSAVLILAAGGIWVETYLGKPAGEDATSKVFTILPGQDLGTVAQNLATQGLITDPFRFKLYARFKGAAARLKAGEYQLSAVQSPREVLGVLLSGKVMLYRLTLPEGLNLEEVAALMEGAGICPKEEVLDLGQDLSFIQELGFSGPTLEGYLFPDTYLYPRTITCRQMIRTMTTRFKTIFNDRWIARAQDLGFSVHEMVTLASIIEKETGDPEERPLISSVFHNRLKKKMRLQSDPTVIYGVADYEGRIRTRHLKQQTPYNTYQIQGLPPGPIANPGAKALEAALYPAQSDFLFFVSKNDSTHHFSVTLAQHNQAVRKYQLNR